MDGQNGGDLDDLRRLIAANSRNIEILIDVAADTNRRVSALTSSVASVSNDIAGLTWVMRLRLIHDHGYDEPDDDEPH